MSKVCRVGTVEIGEGRPLTVIAGPCVLEGRDNALVIGRTLRDACARLGLAYVFKASFDKANRSRASSPRGPGLEQGLAALAGVGEALDCPVTTDVHEAAQAASVADTVDLLQIPAFLCRQTDLLLAAGEAAAAKNRGVNVKKGQFLSPTEMAGPAGKLLEAGCSNLMFTERGTFFGYDRLVNDFLGFGDLLEVRAKDARGVETGPFPVCFDCTHSTQLPGAGRTTGGRPDRAGLLARAAVAAGAHAVFLETHPDPAHAASDAATMLPLDEVPAFLTDLARIRAALEPAGAAGAAATSTSR